MVKTFRDVISTYGWKNMYNTNIVIGSQKEDLEKKKAKCDVLAVYMPDEEIQTRVLSKQSKDYRGDLFVYQPTTYSLQRDLKKEKRRKLFFGLLFAILIILFMALGGLVGYAIYKGTH